MAHQFESVATIRFGYGFRPVENPVGTVAEILDRLAGPDVVGETLASVGFEDRHAAHVRYNKSRRQYRKKNTAETRKERSDAKNERNKIVASDLKLRVSRSVLSHDGFRERLVAFWADHFSVSGQGRFLQLLHGDFVDRAIRPFITGTFAELLTQAVTHPSMLIYLDQVKSFGPNSESAKRKNRGLNENLAREILELHTMGVQGGYSQDDVRQFAELLTGMTVTKHGSHFKPAIAEPGAETVLGKSYGGSFDARFRDVKALLDDLAVHPKTARHLAKKLAIHFVSDTPDEALVARLESVFLDTDGDLFEVYTALLEHPSSWQDLGQKVKQPFGFVVSGLRALSVPEDVLLGLKPAQVRRLLSIPMSTMGQPLRAPPGPDGWPEEAEAWITPQGLAARLQWSLVAGTRFGQRADPRDFVEQTLRDVAGETLRRAVAGSENRAEGLALVLASPEFNRR